MRLVLVGVVALGACKTPIDELDGAYYAWDGRKVHCAVEIDDAAGYDLAAITAGLDRVHDTGEVIELLVHAPGATISFERLEQVLAAARDRELPFLTARDMLRGPAMAGVALMYDDWHTPAWLETAPMLAEYGARVTMYVARYPTMSEERRAQLAELEAAGHDIEAHSVKHLRGPTFVEEYGLHAYVEDEVKPSIELLRADGYEVLSYAYPFGVRTDETDHAILDDGAVEMVRALAKPRQLRANPCPY